MTVYLAILLIVVVVVLAWSAPCATRQQFNHEVDHSDYFDRLSGLDLQTRRADSLESYRARYRAAFQPLTWHERIKIAACLPPDILKTKYLIAKVDGVEMNHPHTLGRCIMLTSDALAGDLRGILAHEYVHIFQRYNPTATAGFLSMLGFYPAAPLNHPRSAANPDVLGDYEIIIQNKAFSPQLIYCDGAGNYTHNMQDVLIAADGEIRYTPYWPYKNIKLAQSQPNEIMAELIAQHISGNLRDRDISDWIELIK
jgi:hypothetical protein